jgi:tRNA A-37 threonylcarbamoyl transferase component Bud32
MTQRKPGEQFGEWTLREVIRTNRNAEVWKADRDGPVHVIKILNRKRGATEPSLRFDREIRVQRTLTDEQFPGILPVLDTSDLDDPLVIRSWIVTPLAEPMPTVVQSLPVPERVAAIQVVAETLGRLHARGFDHRDIKPDNLFRYQGQWVVGDFGLVHVDDAEPITEVNAVIGPRFFMAHEMITNASAADGAKADVFSLAKTLWVILTNQNHPHPGPHQPHEPLMRLSTYVDHPQLGTLDLLIARATTLRPQDRPSAHEIARELARWRTELAALEPLPQGGVEAIRQRLAQAMRPALDLQAAESARNDAIERAFSILVERLVPIRDGYAIEGFPPPDIERSRLIAEMTGLRNLVLIGREHGEASGTCVRLTHRIPKKNDFLGGEERWVSLNSGFGIRATLDGTLYLAVSHVITQYNRAPQLIGEDQRDARVGSAALDHACRDLPNSLVASTEEALAVFLQRVEELE